MSYLKHLIAEDRIKQKIEHMGEVIHVTNDYYFYVVMSDQDPDDDRAQHFDTFSKAKGYIEDRIKAREKATKTKVALPVLRDDDGVPAIVTGINANTSELNGVGGASEVYPQVPWISALLKRSAEIKKEQEEIRRAIYPYRIRSHRGYGRISSSEYEKAVKSLVSEHAEKLADAKLAGTKRAAEGHGNVGSS